MMVDTFVMGLTMSQWVRRVLYDSFCIDPLSYGCPSWWMWGCADCSRIITGTARGV